MHETSGTGLSPGRNCWRIEQADRASVIVDADEYFRLARQAMQRAQRRIMLIGWDFDARIMLDRGEEAGDGPLRVGDFLLWLVNRNPDLEIYLLRWDIGAVKTLLRGSTILTVIKWLRHPRIHTRLDAHHPAAASHHQKIVVLDDRFAFCGGIDMTGGRWDTRAHADHDSGRKLPDGTPHGPWHDATTALSGPVAAALGEHARDRWRRAGGPALAPVTDGADCWPDALAATFSNVAVAIARTAPDYDGEAAVTEIEQLYVDQIAAAERTIYAESQYFASRRVAEAIAKRLDEADGPEIVLINPVTAQGWLEPLAMDSARARLFEVLRRRDLHRRFRIYHPATAEGDPIYVHAKIMIVDDRMLRVGSSNMNNRSMRLDTECDVAIDVVQPGNGACAAQITHVRDDLLAEHLGVTIDVVRKTLAETGSLIATIEALRGSGKTLVPYETPDLGAVERWLAENEVLDAEGPGAMIEGVAKGGLLRRLRRR